MSPIRYFSYTTNIFKISEGVKETGFKKKRSYKRLGSKKNDTGSCNIFIVDNILFIEHLKLK